MIVKIFCTWEHRIGASEWVVQFIVISMNKCNFDELYFVGWFSFFTEEEGTVAENIDTAHV